MKAFILFITFCYPFISASQSLIDFGKSTYEVEKTIKKETETYAYKNYNEDGIMIIAVFNTKILSQKISIDNFITGKYYFDSNEKLVMITLNSTSSDIHTKWSKKLQKKLGFTVCNNCCVSCKTQPQFTNETSATYAFFSKGENDDGQFWFSIMFLPKAKF